jgi:cytochrome c biogenesis protein CcmG, thiol:disulfide interchange protein DsbE
MKYLRYALPLLLFVGLAVLLKSGLGKDTRTVPSPLVGKPAPAFDLPELRDSAQRVTSAGLRGQTYLLNVWGSWCVACAQEHPILMRLAGSGRLPIIGLNWKDERDAALDVLRRGGDPYSAIAADDVGRTAIDFGVYGAPESFLIDGNGMILYKHIGPLDWAAVEKELFSRLPAKPKS